MHNAPQSAHLASKINVVVTSELACAHTSLQPAAAIMNLGQFARDLSRTVAVYAFLTVALFVCLVLAANVWAFQRSTTLAEFVRLYDLPEIVRVFWGAFTPAVNNFYLFMERSVLYPCLIVAVFPLAVASFVVVGSASTVLELLNLAFGLTPKGVDVLHGLRLAYVGLFSYFFDVASALFSAHCRLPAFILARLYYVVLVEVLLCIASYVLLCRYWRLLLCRTTRQT